MKAPLPSTDNPILPNHESYQSSIANFHILLPYLLAPMPSSRIPLIIGERDRRIVRWREIGFRLHHRYRVARPSPRFLPRVSRRIRLGGLVSRRVGNVARDRRGASAFQPSPRRKFSRAMSSEIDSRPQLPDKSDINVESAGHRSIISP